jgi:hypothetical protein
MSMASPGGRTKVHIDKQTVARKLREQGEHDRAQQADCALPQQVDTDRDAGLLHQFDVSVRELAAADAEDGDLPSGES